MQNKFVKFLTSAIGEVIFIVIGILLAMEIDNWNDRRSDMEKESLIIQNLELEFEKNRAELVEDKATYQKRLHAIAALLDLVGASKEQLAQVNLDSAISKSINYFQFNPTQNVLLDVISSGNFELIRSENLRKLLLQWSANLRDAEDAFDALDHWGQDMLFPYLARNTSLKNIDSYSLLHWEDRSRLQSDPSKLFYQLEFENTIDNHAWCLQNYNNELSNLLGTIDAILAEINEVQTQDEA